MMETAKTVFGKQSGHVYEDLKKTPQDHSIYSNNFTPQNQSKLIIWNIFFKKCLSKYYLEY